MQQIPAEGFLRLSQILGDSKTGAAPIIPIGKTAWWNGIKAGRFPKPIKLGRKVSVWRVDDIRSLITKAGG